MRYVEDFIALAQWNLVQNSPKFIVGFQYVTLTKVKPNARNAVPPMAFPMLDVKG